jgi:diphosphomevalonate decarboxylase
VSTATALAHPNIALCKYWGKRDRALNLPATPSLSLTVAPFASRTTVTWGSQRDEAWLNGRPASALESSRIFATLDLFDAWRPRCQVVSENDFPTAAGLASSSSGFAALVVAASAASGAERTLEQLSVLARRGSGSAARSVFGGWVEWRLGERADGADSHGIELHPPTWWDVRLVVAVFDAEPKSVSSTDGMNHCQATSPAWRGWVESAPADVEQARRLVSARDLPGLGAVMERSTLRMHACMMSADPPLYYWNSGTAWGMDQVRTMRARGLRCAFTIDAGPNVKVLCGAADSEEVALRLGRVAERVHVLHPGPAAHLVEG